MLAPNRELALADYNRELIMIDMFKRNSKGQFSKTQFVDDNEELRGKIALISLISLITVTIVHYV